MIELATNTMTADSITGIQSDVTGTIRTSHVVNVTQPDGFGPGWKRES